MACEESDEVAGCRMIRLLKILVYDVWGEEGGKGRRGLLREAFCRKVGMRWEG